MLNNSPLLITNEHFEQRNGVFQDSNTLHRESRLSNETEMHIRKLFESASNKALFSPDFEYAKTNTSLNNTTLTAIDAAPFCFLQNLNLSRIGSVLDLSEDIGGVAHFLADHIGVVDSFKIDPIRAQLAAIRCSNKPNVTHFTHGLIGMNFPKQSYDLIVVGQLEKLDLTKQELDSLLAILRAALTNTGILLINTPNRDRLSRLLNTGVGGAIPYSDAYTPSTYNETVIDVTRRGLRNSVLANDFETVDFHATFSQKNTVSNLFSENYLTSNVYALNHFYQLGYLDKPELSEYLVFKRLYNEKECLFDLASRFIMMAGVKIESLTDFYNNDFSYYSNTSLLPHWRTITARKRSSHEVLKQSVFPEPNAQSEKVTQNLSATTFHKGTLLSGEWLNALLKNDNESLTINIEKYRVWLTDLANKHTLSMEGFNLLSRNIIINVSSGNYYPINSQWQTTKAVAHKITVDFVLFRALFWFAHENQALFTFYAHNHDIYSIGNFILRHLPEYESLTELAPFIELEQDFQNDIVTNISDNFIDKNVGRMIVIDAAQSNQKISDSYSLNDDLESANQELERQGKRILEYQTQLSSTNSRVGDLKSHRDDLVELVSKIEGQIEIERNTQGNLYAQIEHLEARLHAQHVRNDELHSFLLMRPSTRLKSFARRWLDRLNGKSTSIEPILIENAYEDSDEKMPFAELPEGELIGMNTESYEQWISENTLTDTDIERVKADIDAMPYKPVFSILVPIYNTDPEYLLPMIESVRNQIYPHWQLCLVDDCSPKTYLKRILEQQTIDDDRIVIKLNDVNQGISVTTNDALGIATGDYIALLDHDDEITIDALYENAKIINSMPDAGLIYSDEDKMELDGSRIEPYFKPDYSPDLLDTNNYICHFTVIKKTIMEQIGGFREGLDGSQDHDVILRATRAAKQVVHIPKVLYHWRKIPGSTAVEYDSKGYAWEAGRKAIEDLHRKYEDNVRVEFGALKGSYRLIRDIVAEPLVSIIIPFKDKPELLDSCINSVLKRSSYSNFEIIGVSNNSEQVLTHERMVHFSQADARIRFIEYNVPFNFSDICNYGVSHAKGDYIVLLNNDIEILSPDWIECMLEHAQRDQVGAVGCKLVFPDGRIQHAGVVAGMVGAAGHTHKFFPEQHIGYNGRLHMVSNVSAVTGAMMMISKSKFNEVNGLDAENLAVAYNDIDLCLKLINSGYLNVFTPHARAIHHESISRGYEDTDEKMQRLLKEQRHFLATWESFLEKGDPFYNPNMSLKNERFSFNFKD